MNRHHAAAGALTSALALALAGCGGSSGGDAARSTPASSAATATATTPSASPSSPSASSASPSSASVTTTAPPASASVSSAAAAVKQLPLGGRSIFPAYRVVAYYGSSSGDSLGVLGKGTPRQAAAAIEKTARGYAPFGRTVQPAMELIVTVAQASAGKDGTYSQRLSDESVQRYLAVAKAHKMLLILDFQPGRGEFLPQVKGFEKFLRDPAVGVALDPEWKIGPGQKPAQVIGHSSAASINVVSAYVAGIVKSQALPEKLFVVHQFSASMLPDRSRIVHRPGLATVLHADGNGTPKLKKAVFQQLAFPKPFHIGFKLFFTKDSRLMTPAETMRLAPQPDLVTYQ